MAKRNKNGLTELQQAFADAYLCQPHADRSATAAYRSCRPDATDRTCETQGNRLLNNSEVAAYIEERDNVIIGELEERQVIAQEQIIRELVKLGMSDITEVLSWTEDGQVFFRPSRELTEVGRAMIKGVKYQVTDRENKDGEVTTTRRMELVLHDKVKPLELLGKHTRAFVEQIDLPQDSNAKGMVVLPADIDVARWQQMVQSKTQSGT